MFYDFIISGAGLSGVLAAQLLKKLGLSYYIFDQSANRRADYRTSAISYESATFFDTLGLWDAIAPSAAPILDIYTFQEKSVSFLHFESSDADLDSPMGYVVPNLVLQDLLYRGVDINYAQTYKKIDYSHDKVRVNFQDGAAVEGRYMLVSEGRNSSAAGLLGFKTISASYRQACIICNLRSSGEEHSNIAIELFQEGGPFAMLPMTNKTDFSLAWGVKCPFAEVLKNMEEEEFLKEVGRIAGIEFKKILTPRVSYPLTLSFCMNPRKGPVLLIGDSFHAIHPVIAQGFNLSIYDLRDLYNTLNKYGLDAFDDLIDVYVSGRKKSVFGMIAFTDFLVRVFSVESVFMRYARGLALDFIESSAALKRFCVNRATGKDL